MMQFLCSSVVSELFLNLNTKSVQLVMSEEDMYHIYKRPKDDISDEEYDIVYDDMIDDDDISLVPVLAIGLNLVIPTDIINLIYKYYNLSLLQITGISEWSKFYTNTKEWLVKQWDHTFDGVRREYCIAFGQSELHITFHFDQLI